MVIEIKESERKMAFPETLRRLRTQKGVSLYEMAKSIGVTTRCLQNYESGVHMPRNPATITKIALYLGVSPDELMGPEDHCVMAALESGGGSAEREMRKVMTELCALFSGGKLKENDRESVVYTLNDIYWDSKSKAQEKYAPGGR